MVLCGIDYPVKPDNDSFYLCFEGARSSRIMTGTERNRRIIAGKKGQIMTGRVKNGNKGENDGEDLKRNDGSLSPRRCISRDRIIS